MLGLLPVLAAFGSGLSSVHAATAEEWRGRSLYQLITDRFAPASDTAPARTSPLPTTCDPHAQTWCGGTWLSIIDKLDYLQGMGIDAIWISPTSQNIDVDTPYNFAYHGYWVNNPLILNPRFGTSDDLLALSAALHARGMYLMVDIAIGFIPALNVDAAQSTANLEADNSLWTDPSEFHQQCWIDYNNNTSVEFCWMGDNNLALMDVNTENANVTSVLQTWVADYVKTYSIDGLRIDAAKHIPGTWWPGFCGSAGVFCTGEVYGSDMGFATEWQSENWMDSILGYPLYFAIVDAFGTPMGNMSAFVEIGQQVVSQFQHPEYLPNFLENHDLPRWRNTTVDPQLSYNAIVLQHMFDGIPLVYYGQEQDFQNGAADPYNRAALWPSNYTNTTTYQRIARLNQIRHAVIANNTQYSGKNFLDSRVQFLGNSSYDVAFRKGPLVAVLTNRGSPSQNATFGVGNSGFNDQATIVDVLSCTSWTVASGGTISISYSASGYGGMPYLFMSQADVISLNLCANVQPQTYTQTTSSSSSSSSHSGAAPMLSAASASLVLAPILAAIAWLL